MHLEGRLLEKLGEERADVLGLALHLGVIRRAVRVQHDGSIAAYLLRVVSFAELVEKRFDGAPPLACQLCRVVQLSVGKMGIRVRMPRQC